MKSLVFCAFLLGTVSCRSVDNEKIEFSNFSRSGDENLEKIFDSFRSLIPDFNGTTDDFKSDENLQNEIFKIVYDRLFNESQSLNDLNLRAFVECSCPKPVCVDLDIDFESDFSDLFSEVRSGVSLEYGVRLLRMIRIGLDQVELRRKDLFSMVDCLCPNANSCRSNLSPIGAPDVREVDPSKQIPGFPNGIPVPANVVAPLQSAWNGLVEMFGNLIPTWVNSENKTVEIAPGVEANYVSGTFGNANGLSGAFGGVSTGGLPPPVPGFVGSVASSGSNAHAGSNAQAGTNIHSGSNANSGSNAHSGTNIHSGSNSHSGTNVNSGSNAHSGTNTHQGTNVGPSNTNGPTSGSVHNVNSKPGPTVDIIGPTSQTGSAGSIHVTP